MRFFLIAHLNITGFRGTAEREDGRGKVAAAAAQVEITFTQLEFRGFAVIYFSSDISGNSSGYISIEALIYILHSKLQSLMAHSFIITPGPESAFYGPIFNYSLKLISIFFRRKTLQSALMIFGIFPSAS